MHYDARWLGVGAYQHACAGVVQLQSLPVVWLRACNSGSFHPLGSKLGCLIPHNEGNAALLGGNTNNPCLAPWLQFASIDEYLGVFDPLILEEAREGLKADWAESCTAGKLWEVGGR